jgi:hypothetical protein
MVSPFSYPAPRLNPTAPFCESPMRNDDLDLRADPDDMDPFPPRATHHPKREKSLVLQVALGVFLGGLALWLVQLGATAIMAKLAMGTFQFGG